MAVWSEIPISEIEHYRIDAEFYQPKYLYASSVAGNIRLKNYGVSVIHPSEVKRVYSASGLRIMLAQNNRDNYYDWTTERYMPPQMASALITNKLYCGDVTVTRSGANFGQTSVITIETEEDDIYACADLLIIKTSQISGPLLSTYLNTKIGKLLMNRGVYGAGQPHVAPSYVKEIQFPHFLIDYSAVIDNLVFSARKKSKLSNFLYTQAQELLEKELGLDQLIFPKKLYSVSNFNQVVNSHRLDAQHYQLKFEILINHLKQFKCETIRKIRVLNRRGLQPIYIQKGSIDVVNSQHITSTHLAYDKFEKTSQSEFDKNKEAQIQKNDVLIYTTGAYIGQTNIYDSDKPAMASNHVNILRINGVDSGYLAMLFQSIIGKFQTEKHARGSAQSELYPSDIDKFIIPILNSDKQKKIGQMLQGSLIAKKESEQLLEHAKRQVEELIEGAI